MARTALLNVMVQAVLKAGRSLSRDFGEVENLQVSLKGPGDFVSAADRKAEKILVAELSKARPGVGFLTEESPAIAGSDATQRWLIDPLDGTTNFLHGIPIFAVSVALEREGQVVAGVIYNPIQNELYVAERGGGAFLNDRRLRVAARSDLREAVIGTGAPHIGKSGHDRFLAEAKRIMAEAAGIRRCGAAALDLAYVAAGRFDGYWERALNPWDIGAGIILVREAGGIATDLDGSDKMLVNGSILASNHALHRKLLGLLSKPASEG